MSWSHRNGKEEEAKRKRRKLRVYSKLAYAGQGTADLFVAQCYVNIYILSKRKVQTGWMHGQLSVKDIFVVRIINKAIKAKWTGTLLRQKHPSPLEPFCEKFV